MAAGVPLVALCALFWSGAAAGPAGAGGPVSLVQSSVLVHGPGAGISTKGTYLVDNSQLHHKGPGVLLRRSKNFTDTASKSKFVEWGTVIDGVATGDGWVQFKDYFLPTHIRGVQVMTLQAAEEPVAPASPTLRRKVHIHYAPTEVQVQDGSWVPCAIRGLGSKPETYNIEVRPRKFSRYNMTNVPATSLKKVQRIREFIPVKAVPTSAPKTALNRAVQQEAQIRLRVNDTSKGHVMDLRMMKKSPMRTLMKMACERSKVSWYKCERKVKFIWNKNPVHADAHSSDLGISDGETIQMIK